MNVRLWLALDFLVYLPVRIRYAVRERTIAALKRREAREMCRP